jgi:hypothetical protein
MDATAKQNGGLAALGVVTAVLVIAAHGRTAPVHHEGATAHSPGKVKSHVAQPLPYIRSAEVTAAAGRDDKRDKAEDSASPAPESLENTGAVEQPVAAPAPAATDTIQREARDAGDSGGAASAGDRQPAEPSGSVDGGGESAPTAPETAETEPEPAAAQPASEPRERRWWERRSSRDRSADDSESSNGPEDGTP